MDSSDKKFDPHSLLPTSHPQHPDHISTHDASEKPLNHPLGRPLTTKNIPPGTLPIVPESDNNSQYTTDKKISHPFLWNSPPPAPQSEQKPSPAFTTEKKKKPFTIILVSFFIIALFAGAVGGGWYLWQQGYFAGISVLSPIGPLSPVAVSPNAKSLDLNAPASWETYTSSESGFMLKHPGNVRPTVLHEGDQTITVFTLVGPTQQKDTEFHDGISLQFMSGELGDETLEAYVKHDEEALKQTAEVTNPTAPTQINGITGYTYSVSGSGDITFIYLPDGGGYLKIVNLTKDPGDLGYEKIVSDMLQTLRFTAEGDGE